MKLDNNKISTEEWERVLLVVEIAEYVYTGFELIRKYGTIGKVIQFIDKNLHRVVYMREGNTLVGVAIYMMVTDLTLENIVKKKIDLTNPGMFEKVSDENGENMHVFAIRADRMGLILKGIKDVFKVKNPKTISWIKPNMKSVVVIRGDK